MSSVFPTQPWDLGARLNTSEPLLSLLQNGDADNTSVQGHQGAGRGARQGLLSAWHKATLAVITAAIPRMPGTFPSSTPALLPSRSPRTESPGWGSSPDSCYPPDRPGPTVPPHRGGVGPSGPCLQPSKCSWSLVFCSVAGPFVFIAYRFCRGALKGCHCSNGCFRFASVKPHLMKTSLRSSFS